MRQVCIIASALVLAAVPAFAQTTNATSTLQNSATVNSQASAQSGVAAARGGSVRNQILIQQPTVDPAASSGNGGGDPTINYSGGYTLRNVPEVIAPNVIGGNPCAVGASAGLAVSGFGITGGGTWADKQCERRQEAALLYNIGQHDASIALLCQDDNVRAAVLAAGKTCPGYAPPAVASAAPAAVVAAAPPPSPIVKAVVTPTAPPPIPDWCTAVTGRAEQIKYQTECRFLVTDSRAATKARR